MAKATSVVSGTVSGTPLPELIKQPKETTRKTAVSVDIIPVSKS